MRHRKALTQLLTQRHLYRRLVHVVQSIVMRMLQVMLRRGGVVRWLTQGFALSQRIVLTQLIMLTQWIMLSQQVVRGAPLLQLEREGVRLRGLKRVLGV